MMKALTLYQPWASLIALGEKRFETRSWWTGYRGPILIHAGKKDPCKMPLLGMRDFKEAVGSVFEKAGSGYGSSWCLLPKGRIIAIAELVNCWHIVNHPGTNVDEALKIPIGAESMTTDKHAPDFADYIVPTEKEMLFGDWTPGRYAWELKNVHRLVNPIPEKGMQRLWSFDVVPHMTAVNIHKSGSTKIWTPTGVISGQKVNLGEKGSVAGLEVF